MSTFADPCARVPLLPARAEALERLVRSLAVGVNAHRLACIDAGLAPEPHDLALWGLLESLTLVPILGDRDGAGEPVTLAEAVCGGIWTERPTDSYSPINPSPKGTTR